MREIVLYCYTGIVAAAAKHRKERRGERDRNLSSTRISNSCFCLLTSVHLSYLHLQRLNVNNTHALCTFGLSAFAHHHPSPAAAVARDEE